MWPVGSEAGRNPSETSRARGAANYVQDKPEAEPLRSPFENRTPRAADLSIRELILCPLYRCVPKDYEHKVIRRGQASLETRSRPSAGGVTEVLRSRI